MSAPTITGRATPSQAVAGAGDVELLAALRSGDRAACGELYRRHRPQVATYLARRMVCAGDVDDVVQDTFLRLWDTPAENSAAGGSAAGDSVGEFDPAAHEFGAWLCGRVVRWALIDYGRRDRFRQLAALGIARDHARRGPTGSSPSAHQLAARPKGDALRAAFAALRAPDGSTPDVTAALGWLRERGIRVDPSYAYAIRNHRRGAPAAGPSDTDPSDTAARPGRWAA